MVKTVKIMRTMMRSVELNSRLTGKVTGKIVASMAISSEALCEALRVPSSSGAVSDQIVTNVIQRSENLRNLWSTPETTKDCRKCHSGKARNAKSSAFLMHLPRVTTFLFHRVGSERRPKITDVASNPPKNTALPRDSPGIH